MNLCKNLLYNVNKEGGVRKMKKCILKILANIALLMTICNVNSTCLFWTHQPIVPDKAKKLRRF